MKFTYKYIPGDKFEALRDIADLDELREKYLGG